MSTDWRAELQALISAYDAHGGRWPQHHEDALMAAVEHARAALAQPEPEVVGPTYDDLSELCAKHGLDADSWPTEEFDALWEVSRAVLARYSHQPAAPAEGEVAELVAWIRGMYWAHPDKERATRAADLLEQRHPTPVPVSEGLPSASHVYFEFVISDADDCTQAGGIAPTYAQALSEGQHYLAQYQQDGPHTLELRRVEVLPPGALPLPQGEVQP